MLVAAVVLALSLLVSSCGPTGGQIFYFLGVGQSKKVKAKYKLSPGPILILIDDPQERVDWPVANHLLFDALTQELLKNKATEKTIPYETIQGLRQSDPKFAELSCREIGEKVQADQVLWLEIQFFHAREELDDINEAGVFAVSVRVINPQEKEKRSAVRLWPASSEGFYVAATLTALEVDKFKTRDVIAQALAQELAEKIAKLFYDYKLEATEKEPGEE